MFREGHKSTCLECTKEIERNRRKGLLKVQVRTHKCKNCGETNPENFYSGQKSICKECVKANNREIVARNPEKKKEYDREYAKKNSNIIKIRTKKWREENRNYINNYLKDKRDTDISIRFITNLRSRQRQVLKGKASTTEGLGCSTKQLREHLASQFTEGMSFDNYGFGKDKWHMEHIIPLASHEKDENGDWNANSEYNKKLIHYTNLQPLWEPDNLDKGSNINEEDFILFLERVI